MLAPCYDRFGRTLQDGELTMAHDANGNVTSLVYPGGVEAVSTGGGHSPILSQVQLGSGGTRTYRFGPAGHLERVASGADETLYRTDAAGRLGQPERPTTRGDATFWYDGRDFLSFADPNDLPFRDGFESATPCAWAATASGPASTPCPGRFFWYHWAASSFLWCAGYCGRGGWRS